MRASPASLGPGVLQGWTCETEQFLGVVSAPCRLCTTAANVSRAAWLYVRQGLAQAGVKPPGQPLPFTAELGVQAAALLLTLEPQGRVSCALLLTARLPLLLSHVLPAAVASEPQHRAGGSRAAPPEAPGCVSWQGHKVIPL